MREILWQSLVASIQAGQCVVVLGPDIATAPDAPDQSEGPSIRERLSRYLAERLEEEGVAVGERILFSVAQQCEDAPSFATIQIRNIAASFLAKTTARPGPLHAELAKLPVSLVLTTCHDRLLASAMVEQGKTPVEHQYHFRGEPRDNRDFDDAPSATAPIIYHLFGSYERLHSLVLSENDLLDFAINVVSGKPKLPDGLRAALRNKTLLFFGFGIRHFYIRVLLKLLLRSLEISAGAVALESLSELDPREREQTVLFYRRGSRVEVIDVPAPEFVAELTARLAAAGGASAPAPRRCLRKAQVFISYERSDVLVARRLRDALPASEFDTWFDQKSLEVGDDWNQEIEDRIRVSDYFVVLNSPNLANKQKGYVNKEVHLGLDQQLQRKTGSKYVVPLLVNGQDTEAGHSELRKFNQLPLRATSFDEDVAELAKTLSRDFQLRMRQG